MEHFASSLIHKKILVALNGLKLPEHQNNTVVALFTPEHERHELPLLMMQYALRKNNIRTVLLGQHVSMEMLRNYCRERPATHLYGHIITYLQRYDVDEYVAELSSAFLDKQILLSGRIVQSLQRKFVNVRILNDEEMETWYDELK